MCPLAVACSWVMGCIEVYYNNVLNITLRYSVDFLRLNCDCCCGGWGWGDNELQNVVERRDERRGAGPPLTLESDHHPFGCRKMASCPRHWEQLSGDIKTNVATSRCWALPGQAGAGQLVSTSCPLEFKSYEDFLAEDWDQIIEQKYLPGYFWKMWHFCDTNGLKLLFSIKVVAIISS